MQEYLGEAHDSAVLVVTHQPGSVLMLLVYGIHKLPAPETDVGTRILGVQATHQVRAMQVSRGFSG